MKDAGLTALENEALSTHTKRRVKEGAMHFCYTVPQQYLNLEQKSHSSMAQKVTPCNYSATKGVTIVVVMVYH